MRIDALHHLAVELHHQAQNAMRRRVLRPEIDGEVAEVFGHGPYPLAWLSAGGAKAANTSAPVMLWVLLAKS